MSEQQTLSVSGMSCTGCEANVEDALDDIDGVDAVEADHEAGAVTVSLSDTVTVSALEGAVEDAGYAVEL